MRVLPCPLSEPHWALGALGASRSCWISPEATAGQFKRQSFPRPGFLSLLGCAEAPVPPFPTHGFNTEGEKPSSCAGNRPEARPALCRSFRSQRCPRRLTESHPAAAWRVTSWVTSAHAHHLSVHHLSCEALDPSGLHVFFFFPLAVETFSSSRHPVLTPDL